MEIKFFGIVLDVEQDLLLMKLLKVMKRWMLILYLYHLRKKMKMYIFLYGQPHHGHLFLM